MKAFPLFSFVVLCLLAATVSGCKKHQTSNTGQGAETVKPSQTKLVMAGLAPPSELQKFADLKLQSWVIHSRPGAVIEGLRITLKESGKPERSQMLTLPKPDASTEVHLWQYNMTNATLKPETSSWLILAIGQNQVFVKKRLDFPAGYGPTKETIDPTNNSFEGYLKLEQGFLDSYGRPVIEVLVSLAVKDEIKD